MLESNFKQHIKEPTYISKNGSTCLDLVFTTTTVRDFGFSDHKCAMVQLQNIPKETSLNFWYNTKRIYKNKKT